jgi:hypothetical protein
MPGLCEGHLGPEVAARKGQQTATRLRHLDNRQQGT